MTRPKFRQHFNADPLSKEMSLKDGRKVLFPEGLKVGSPVLLVGETTNTPLPIGSYEFMHGTKITVTVAGIVGTLIDDVKAGKMSFRSELLSRKEKARHNIAEQIKKLHG